MSSLSIKIGISSCLLGEKVRYDGGHKKNDYLVSTLGMHVKYVPVCPEVECGLSTPREAMHLEGNLHEQKLVTVKSKVDITPQMNKWIKNNLKIVAEENLSGFIFKSKSPSSGMQNIKIYDEKNNIIGFTSGLWARAFMERFPLIPVEDEGRLNDPELRESFIERVFIYARWQELIQQTKKMSLLIDFHARHKLIIMSHCLEGYRSLGQLVANSEKKSVNMIYSEYILQLMDVLKKKATIKKHVNVLQHMSGYLKKNLDVFEKQELQSLIMNYHKSLVPRVVPITLINHYVRKYKIDYLQNQFYLEPHPMELKLRNHV